LSRYRRRKDQERGATFAKTVQAMAAASVTKAIDKGMPQVNMMTFDAIDNRGPLGLYHIRVIFRSNTARPGRRISINDVYRDRFGDEAP
jgi:hypothetical protein